MNFLIEKGARISIDELINIVGPQDPKQHIFSASSDNQIQAMILMTEVMKPQMNFGHKMGYLIAVKNRAWVDHNMGFDNQFNQKLSPVAKSLF